MNFKLLFVIIMMFAVVPTVYAAGEEVFSSSAYGEAHGQFNQVEAFRFIDGNPTSGSYWQTGVATQAPVWFVVNLSQQIVVNRIDIRSFPNDGYEPTNYSIYASNNSLTSCTDGDWELKKTVTHVNNPYDAESTSNQSVTFYNIEAYSSYCINVTAWNNGVTSAGGLAIAEVYGFNSTPTSIDFHERFNRDNNNVVGFGWEEYEYTTSDIATNDNRVTLTTQSPFEAGLRQQVDLQTYDNFAFRVNLSSNANFKMVIGNYSNWNRTDENFATFEHLSSGGGLFHSMNSSGINLCNDCQSAVTSGIYEMRFAHANTTHWYWNMVHVTSGTSENVTFPIDSTLDPLTLSNGKAYFGILGNDNTYSVDEVFVTSAFDFTPPPDLNAPTFTNNQTNNTNPKYGETVKFSIDVFDDVALATLIFGINENNTGYINFSSNQTGQNYFLSSFGSSATAQIGTNVGFAINGDYTSGSYWQSGNQSQHPIWFVVSLANATAVNRIDIRSFPNGDYEPTNFTIYGALLTTTSCTTGNWVELKSVTDNVDPANSNTSVTFSNDVNYLSYCVNTTAWNNGVNSAGGMAWTQISGYRFLDNVYVLSGKSDSGEFIHTVTSTRGETDCGAFYFNDTSNNQNSSEICYTVANTAPTITTTSISPSFATVFDNLTGSIQGYNDVDGDPESGTSYKWYRNGTLISGQTSITLTNDNYVKGSNIIFEATPSDGFDFGQPVNSSVVTIVNNPVLINVSIQFINISPGHGFYAYANATDRDGVGEIVKTNITFTVGTCVNVINTTNGDIFGSLWNCNGTGLQSSDVTIGFVDTDGSYNFTSGANTYPNIDPSITTVNLSPIPSFSNNTIYINYTGFSDADNDTDNGTTFTWYLDYVRIPSATISQLESTNFSVGQTIIGQVNPSDGYSFGTSVNSTALLINNTVITVDLNLPLDGNLSNNALLANFTAYDVDGGISCTLNTNGTSASNTSVDNGILTNLQVTPGFEGTFLWNVSCTSNGDSSPVFSSNRNFFYDASGPTYFDFFDNSVAGQFPQIGDTVTLNVTISDSRNIDYCTLQINDTGSFVDKSNTSIGTSSLYNLSTTYAITDVSTTGNVNVSWRVRCLDVLGNPSTSGIASFNVSDATFPSIALGQTNFDDSNTSIISSARNNVSLAIRYFDYNLFQVEANISCSINGNIFTYENLSITTPEVWINRSVDLSGLPLQSCVFSTSASDDHTAEEIPEYRKRNTNTGFEFDTEHNINLKIESTVSNDKMQKRDAVKIKDRYLFDFEFKDEEIERTFTIESDHKIYPRPNSDYPGHFVVWNPATKGGNWIDFANDGQNNQDFVFNKISDYKYEIKIVAKIPENEIVCPGDENRPPIARGKCNPRAASNWAALKESHALREFKFNSIGGTTIQNLSTTFYIGGGVNVSSINVYDNSSFQNFTVTVTTINSLPGFNGTFLANGTSQGIVDNLTQGNYSFRYSHPHFFNQTVNVSITNASVLEVSNYSSYQSILHVLVKSVATSEILRGGNETLQNLNNSNTIYVFNTTTDFTTYYVNAANYELNGTFSGYDTVNNSLTLNYQQELNYTLFMSFLATFRLKDERTGTQFNISSADRVSFLLFCPESTFTTVITAVNTTLPIDCDYIKFKFVLDYGATTYSRSLILEPNDALDFNVFLIDLTTTEGLLNTFKIDDLLSEYDNPRLYINKVINDVTEQITADFADIENKVAAFLIETNEYIVELHSDNKPIRILGPYSANTAGELTVHLYTVGLNASSSGFSAKVTLPQGLQSFNESGEIKTYAVAVYNDPENQTNSVTYTLYANSFGGTVLYTSTVSPVTTTLEFMTNVTEYLNNTALIGSWTVNHAQGTFTSSKTINDLTEVAIDLFNYLGTDTMNWIIILLLGSISIVATIKTGNYVSLGMIGIASLFNIMGLVALTGSVLALSLIVSVASLLKSNSSSVAT